MIIWDAPDLLFQRINETQLNLCSLARLTYLLYIYKFLTNLNLNVATQMTVPDLNQFLVCIVLQIMAGFWNTRFNYEFLHW